MPRGTIPLRPPEVRWDDVGSMRLFEHRIAAITPVYGGGHEAGKANTEAPVRGQSIRGCLRFWWRAARAAQFDTIVDMRSAESALFGSTAKPSPFDLRVEVGTRGQPKAFQEPAYALFPFRETKASGLQPVCFALSLMASRAAPANLVPELETAIWAWVTFGGYGARTRRGCGALRFEGLPGPRDAQDLAEQAARHLVSGQPLAGVPSLSGARVVLGQPSGEPLEAWKTAVGLYSRFRQGPGMGRNSGSSSGHAGRSRWPEADAIRRLSGQHSRGHEPEHPAGKAFPRADLGAPIIFHFKDAGDPPDHTLEPRGERAGRMASPVVTRPLALADGKFAPMVLLLSAPHIWECPGADLRVNGHGVGKDQIESETIARGTPPLRELDAANARDAIIAFAEQEWKTRAVTLP